MDEKFIHERQMLCYVMRIRNLALCGREKRLNDNDKSTLERAQSLLIAEWMYSLSVSLAEANRD
jgi:hypothetical protein